MKRRTKILALILCVCILSISLFACSKPQEPEKGYFLTGSFNGYAVADEAYKMIKVSDESMLKEAMPDAELYYFIVNAENLTPDAVYGQHYYKVTAGNWDNAWGTEAYDLQPAAVYYDADGNPTGLGSIYIPGDYEGELIVVFDANAKKIYDNTMIKEFTPRVYGDFQTSFGLKNDWDYSDEGSYVMTENSQGQYEVTIDVPAYLPEGEGATMYVVLSAKCYMAVASDYDYISWGANEQYIVSGAGAENVIKPTSPMSYKIIYDPDSNLISIVSQASN